MFVIKMRTIISYIAVIAVIIASFGFIKFQSRNEALPSSSESSVDSDCVPVIMYHNIMKENKKNSRFIITDKQFEEDLKYLKENGYETIVMQDLINYVYNDTPLPEKPIMLTFDDGYYNNYVYAYPMLKNYGFKGVLSIIGYYTDMYTENGEQNENYSHVTWKDVNEMLNSGVFEFQNHSYNLHTLNNGRNGSKKKKGESKEAYKKTLTEDLTTLQNEFTKHTGKSLTTYTYPFGSVSNDSFDIIKEIGFKGSFSCESGVNTITKNPDCLYMLKRTIRTPGISVNKILNQKK